MPQPDCLTPPCGVSDASVKCSLIQTCPNSSAFATRIALPMSDVKTDDARPYGVSLAHWTAVSSSEKRWTVTTGPKISSWMISDFWSGPAITVGG